jgi:hypothetical protein
VTDLASGTTNTVTAAATIENVAEPVEPLWFASPANVYEADAVFEPTAMLFAYVGVGVNDNPPTPVTAAVHGVKAAPV